MTFPSLSSWVFALKIFAAAVLALYLALWLDLPRPYWAMATVYITSQRLSGATRSKAAYRLAGTAAGAAYTVFIVPVLANSPELLTLALTLWLGLCLYLSLLDRTPRSYAFMLAGYTAALIAFPSVATPESIFDTALARVEEITLGIICASLVSTIILPEKVGSVVASQIEAWLKDAGNAACEVLRPERSDVAPEAMNRGLRLAGDAVQIDGLLTHLAYEAPGGRGAARWVALLRERMLLLLPSLSSISDRLQALRDGGALDDELRSLLGEISAWIQLGPTAPPAEAERLHTAIRAATPDLAPDSGWHDIVRANLMIRLHELVDIRQDCRILQRQIAKDWGRLRQPLALGSEVPGDRHVDHGLAMLSALGAMAATLILSAIWIFTGWADGASAVMMAAIACCFFASQDDPVPRIVGFANWTMVSFVFVGLYSFVILPAINGFVPLVAALSLLFIPVGLLIANPATFMIGMTLGANGATLMALQANFSGADFAGFLNGNLAVVIGMWSAAILTRIFRTTGVDSSVRRLRRAGRLTLARAAERRGRGDRARFLAIMLDRLGLLAPRLATLGAADQAGMAHKLLSDLRVGLNLIEIRRARHSLAPDAVKAIDAMLDGLARHYRSGAETVAPALLTEVDAALGAVMATPDPARQRDALLGLVGVRRGLFPDAPPYAPAPPPDPAELKIAA
jgi:uncharacterized membrane protein YccC